MPYQAAEFLSAKIEQGAIKTNLAHLSQLEGPTGLQGA
jgi:hypothetical protein